MKVDVKENIGFQDENIVVYPAGDNIIIYDLNRKTQKFINGASVGVGVESIGKFLNLRNLQVNLWRELLQFVSVQTNDT